MNENEERQLGIGLVIIYTKLFLQLLFWGIFWWLVAVSANIFDAARAVLLIGGIYVPLFVTFVIVTWIMAYELRETFFENGKLTHDWKRVSILAAGSLVIYHRLIGL